MCRGPSRTPVPTICKHPYENTRKAEGFFNRLNSAALEGVARIVRYHFTWPVVRRDLFALLARREHYFPFVFLKILDGLSDEI